MESERLTSFEVISKTLQYVYDINLDVIFVFFRSKLITRNLKMIQKGYVLKHRVRLRRK